VLLRPVRPRCWAGAQAETYADHFIKVHLSDMGGTYAQLSAQAMAQPNNAALQGKVATVFKGTMLRGTLLDAYAFWKIGAIAGLAAIFAYAAAALMLILSLLGLAHLRRVAPEAEVLPKVSHRTKVAVAA